REGGEFPQPFRAAVGLVTRDRTREVVLGQQSGPAFQHAAGTDINEAFDTVLLGGFEQRLRPAHVGFLGNASRFASELEGGAEMNDDATTPYRRGHAGAIA